MDSGTNSAGRKVSRTTDLRLQSERVNFPALYKSCRWSFVSTKTDSTQANLQLSQVLDTGASPWLQYASFSVKPPDAAPPAQSGKLAPVWHHTHWISDLDQDMWAGTLLRWSSSLYLVLELSLAVGESHTPQRPLGSLQSFPQRGPLHQQVGHLLAGAAQSHLGQVLLSQHLG